MTDNTTKINSSSVDIPKLNEWCPTEDAVYMRFAQEYVEASYDKLGLRKKNKLSLFIIKKDHYKKRMEDICRVINYFLNFYDEEKEFFHSVLQLKFIIDQKPNLKKKAFRNMLLDQVITESFIQKMTRMANDLYTINIDSDTDGKYKNTPKITNDQAKMIVAISFSIRCILPICIHFSDTNNNFLTKTDYIPCFDRIIMKIIKKFEQYGVETYGSLCRFVKYRVDRYWSGDIGICLKKQQLYGITQELYLEEVIHEVILVKSLYKLDYDRSVVSFIDGVIFKYHYNFKIENFKVKPIEIDAEDNSNDSDERLSHIEAIEMMVYRIDESNALINEVNTDRVVQDIRKRFNVQFSQEEYDFYQKNVVITPVTKLFLESFYNKFFHDSNAILGLDRFTIIELLIYMKKYLQYRGMVIIPQLCTAKVRGKYKENTIKNSKFLEKIKTSSSWKNIIQKRYTYIHELSKEDYIIKKFSTLINSQFEFIDFYGPDDGMIYEDIDQDRIIAEFSLFLTII